jgi:recombination protein RecA
MSGNLKDLEKFRSRMEKSNGGPVSSALSEQPKLGIISTGIITCDEALGIGGFVRGFQVMLYGPPQGGKSAFTLNFISEYMKRNPDALVAWIDVERSLKMDWAHKFGADTARIERLVPSTAEESANFYRETIASGIFDIVVLDSIGGMANSVEVDGRKGQGGDANEAIFGGSSMAISRMVRVGNSALARLERSGSPMPVCILINQQRDDLGAPKPGMTKYTGGWALKHMADIVVKVTASNSQSDLVIGSNPQTGQTYKVGSLVRFRTEKNKFAASPRQGEYRFIYDGGTEHEFGVDNLLSVVDLAVLYGLIEQSASWLTLFPGAPEEYKCQGKDKMKSHLVEFPEKAAKIRSLIMSYVYSSTKSKAEGDMIEAEVTSDE